MITSHITNIAAHELFGTLNSEANPDLLTHRVKNNTSTKNEIFCISTNNPTSKKPKLLHKHKQFNRQKQHYLHKNNRRKGNDYLVASRTAFATASQFSAINFTLASISFNPIVIALVTAVSPSIGEKNFL